MEARGGGIRHIKNREEGTLKKEFFDQSIFSVFFAYCNSCRISTSSTHCVGWLLSDTMELAQQLRRVVTKLAKEVGKQSDRIKVSAMIDLCTQIKRSDAGSSLLVCFIMVVFLLSTYLCFVCCCCHPSS